MLEGRPGERRKERGELRLASISSSKMFSDGKMEGTHCFTLLCMLEIKVSESREDETGGETTAKEDAKKSELELEIEGREGRARPLKLTRCNYPAPVLGPVPVKTWLDRNPSCR